MITGEIKGIVENKEVAFNGVQVGVDLFNNEDVVFIRVGNQEVFINKNLFIQVSKMIEESKVGNKNLGLNFINGEIS